jgi:hypothetical protein
MGNSLVNDGTLAQDETQAAALWRLRETISIAVSAAGKQPCATARVTAWVNIPHRRRVQV